MSFMKSLFNTVPGSIVLGSLIIAFSILLSGGVIKIKGVTPQGLGTGNQQIVQASTQPTAPQVAPPQDTGPVKVSLDDDPVLGDKNAPVTLVDFSDYECPFCKRHFDQVYSELKKDYIDTGKVKMVYRDLPLSFHDPMATKEAIAANCARDQGGDTSYFKYHDEIFKTTRSGGKGLEISNLFSIADNLKLNPNLFKECLESERYRDEISKDYTDGINNGVTGTPTFFLGLTTNTNSIKGFKILGPMSYEAFSILIEELLKLNEKNFIQ